jgi:hypothetical protein
MRLAAGWLFVLLASAAVAAAATPKREVAQVGNLRAELTYNQGPEDDYANRFTDLKVSISLAGRPALRERLERGLWPEGIGERKSISIRNLEGDAEPEVVVGIFTGGANCCILTYVYDRAGDSFRRYQHDWGRGGYRIVNYDRGNGVELHGYDARFQCRFASCAATPAPVTIRKFDDGRFLNVTRSFRTPIVVDARRLWKLYLRHRRDRGVEVRGVLAAWVAEEYLLGRGGRGWAALRAAQRRGELDHGGPGTSSTVFLRQLRSFLVRTGYIRR